MFGHQYRMAMQIQLEVEKLFQDLNVINEQLRAAHAAGKNYDVNLLSNRGHQIIEQLHHYGHHLNQMSASA